MKSFSIRKLVSLVALYSFFICAFTGIVLYIAPPNRIAKAIKWTILGLGRGDYVKFHMVFSLVVLFAILLHIYYNIDTIKHYMKLKWEGISFLKSECLVAIIIIIFIFIGTNYNVLPFSQIMKWREDVKTSWENHEGISPRDGNGKSGGRRW